MAPQAPCPALCASVPLMTRTRRGLLWVLVVVAALLALRAAMPYWVRDYLNARLQHMGAYTGRLADVDLHLWRGAYTIHALVIEKGTGKVPVPLLEAPSVELATSWRDLVRGRVVAEVEFRQPRVSFVDGRSNQDGQSGRGVDWRAQLEKLVPIRLDEVRVVDGELVFRNFISEPPVDLRMLDLDATVFNLTNVRDGRGGGRVARLDAQARVLGQAPMEARAEFDPFDEARDFSMDLRIRQIDLRRINALARAYAKLDFASGQGDFVMELDAKDGRLRGYAKPLFTDLEILDWNQDVQQEGDNPLRLAWEALSGAVSDLFKNRPKDQLATRVDISGDIGNAQTSTLDAIFNVLRNAFVEAYGPQFDDLKSRDQESP